MFGEYIRCDLQSHVRLQKPQFLGTLVITANPYSHCEELWGCIGNVSYVAIALTSSTGVIGDLEDVETSIRTLSLLV